MGTSLSLFVDNNILDASQQGLLEGNILLRYRYLRSFVAIGCNILARDGDPVGRDREIVNEALGHTKRALGPLETEVAKTDRQGAIIATVTAKIQEM